MKTILITVILLCFQWSSWGIKPNEVNSPEDCIRLFYQELLSDKSVDECAKIFEEPKTFYLGLTLNKRYKALTNHTTENGVIWSYLRDNKKAFMLDRLTSFEEITKKIKIGYFFLPVQGPDFFKKASLSVVVYSPLKSKIGVWKEVHFPVVYNDNAFEPKYLIDICRCRINGIDLDPIKEWDRSSNLYEELGIQVNETSKEKEE